MNSVLSGTPIINLGRMTSLIDPGATESVKRRISGMGIHLGHVQARAYFRNAGQTLGMN